MYDLQSNYCVTDSQYLIHKIEVLKILEEIGINRDDKRIVEVINKIDLIENKVNFHNLLDQKSIMISAKDGVGIDLLKSKILKCFDNYDLKNVLN